MAIPFLSGLEIATGTHNEITFTGTGGAKILAPVEMYLDASNDIYLMSHSSVNLTLGDNTATFAGDLKVTSDIFLNPDYVNANEYLYLRKHQSADGGIVFQSKTSGGATQSDFQIRNQGSSGDLKFYAYGLSGEALILDRENGNATFAGSVNLSGVDVGGVTSPTLYIGQLTNAYQAGMQSNVHLTMKTTNGSGNFYWYRGGSSVMYYSDALYVDKVVDKGATGYYLDPGSTGTSLNVAGAITTNANNTFKSAAGSGSAVELNLIGTNTSGFGSTHAVRSRIRTVTNDSGNAYASKLEFYTNDPSNNLDLALVLNSNQNATFYGQLSVGRAHLFTSNTDRATIQAGSSGTTGHLYLNSYTGTTLKQLTWSAANSGFYPQGASGSFDLGLNGNRWNRVYANYFYGDGSNLTNVSSTFNGGTVANATTFSGMVTHNGDVNANSHIYGRSVNNQYSNLYKFGGLYLTWDSDSYGTAFEHSLTSSYGGTFNDSITLNSYNHIRFNIDSNNNNGTSYFEVGDGTTGTGNVIFRLSQDGNVNIYGTTNLPEANSQIKIGTFTDGSSNSGIYDDDDILIGEGGSISIFPHRRGDYGLNATTATSTTFRSKLNIWSDNEDHITFGGASTHMVSAWENWKIWINNDSANDGHLQLYNKSTKVEFARLSGGGTNSFVLGTFKATGDLRAPIFYDNANTAYYIDPANTSLAIKVAGEYSADVDHGNSGFIQTWRNTNTGAGAYVEHVIGQSGSSELRVGHAPNYGSSDWNASWVYAVGKPLFLKSSSNNVVIYAGGAGASSEVAIFDTNQNTTFKGDVEIGTSTHNGELTIRSLDSSSSTRTAKLKFNIAGTDTTGFTLHNNTSGIATNTLIYDVSGTEKVTIYGDGHIRTVNNVTAQIFRDQDNTAYYMNPSGGSVLNEISIDDYIYHNGDTDTYLYFQTDTIKLRTGGTDRLTLTNTEASFAENSRFSKEVTDGSGDAIKGYRLNKATSSSWAEGGTGAQTGWYGGNFGGSEITTKWVDGPHGERTLAAETSGDTNNDYDGGYVKAIHNLDINKAHLSIVYIKRISSEGTGNVYHGTGAGTNQITNLSNSSNTNPYFHYPNLSDFPQDVWCVSIGVIQANNDDNTTAKTGSGDLQGIYRCDTGQKIMNSSNAWKMGSAGSTLNNGIRFFHYYSTNANAKVQFAKPGFYEINGDEPSLAEILTGGNRGLHTNGGDVIANRFYDWSNTAFYLDPASTSVVNHMDMDTGNTSGKFAVMSAAVHGSYDFYNNGTSYFNGAVTVDANLNITGSSLIDLGSSSVSIKKTAGGTNGNHAAIELYSSGTADSGSAIAIQQQTSEGDSIIFADYEPHVEWGISTENSNNEIQFTAGNTTGTMGSKTLYNNAGSARTAYKKMIFNLGTGVMSVGGDVRAPIFYDLGNTAYYTNPAGLSQMHTIDFDGVVSGTTTGCAKIGRNHAYDTLELKGYGAELMIGAQHTEININYRTCNNNTSGHTPTTWKWRAGASNNWSNHYFGAVTSNGILTATTDVRAPSFADSNDTNYYLNPAGTGTSLRAAGTVHASNSNMSSYQLNGTYVMDSSRNLVNIAGITSTGDSVFGNSNTDKVVVHGNLGIGDDAYPKIAYPGQNALWGGQGSTTGQIVIDLPGTLANYDMMYMEIDIYEYSGDAATKLIIGGHNWNSNGNSNTSTVQWYNVNVQVLGRLTKPVYFGRRNDGTNERRCIAIGETNSSWSYATVHVSKVHGAEFYGTAIDWVGDWNIAQTTSSSYFTKNPTTNFNDGGSQTFETNGIGEANHWFGSTSVRSPIFYDLDNTSFYINPQGTSVVTAIDANQLYVNDYLYHNGDTDTYMGFSSANQISFVAGGTTRLRVEGDVKVLGATDLNIQGTSRRLQFTAGTGTVRTTTANNLILQANNTTRQTLSTGGYSEEAGSYRAPLFYDSDDTTYYLNPASTSTSLKVAGSVEHKGLSMTDGTNVDQVKEFSMTFQLSANTWTDTGIDGSDLATGTYAMQVYVGDYAVGGNHYDEYYSATISWFSTNTNSTMVDEIPVHRAGHAPNNGDVQFRTQRASNSDTHDLMLQVKHNLSYNAALDGTTTGKKMIFKFRRLI